LFYLWAQSKANGTALNNEFLFSLLSLWCWACTE
jgi:hypothetical protein